MQKDMSHQQDLSATREGYDGETIDSSDIIFIPHVWLQTSFLLVISLSYANLVFLGEKYFKYKSQTVFSFFVFRWGSSFGGHQRVEFS